MRPRTFAVLTPHVFVLTLIGAGIIGCGSDSVKIVGRDPDLNPPEIDLYVVESRGQRQTLSRRAVEEWAAAGRSMPFQVLDELNAPRYPRIDTEEDVRFHLAWYEAGQRVSPDGSARAPPVPAPDALFGDDESRAATADALARAVVGSEDARALLKGVLADARGSAVMESTATRWSVFWPFPTPAVRVDTAPDADPWPVVSATAAVRAAAAAAARPGWDVRWSWVSTGDGPGEQRIYTATLWSNNRVLEGFQLEVHVPRFKPGRRFVRRIAMTLPEAPIVPPSETRVDDARTIAVCAEAAARLAGTTGTPVVTPRPEVVMRCLESGCVPVRRAEFDAAEGTYVCEVNGASGEVLLVQPSGTPNEQSFAGIEVQQPFSTGPVGGQRHRGARIMSATSSACGTGFVGYAGPAGEPGGLTGGNHYCLVPDARSASGVNLTVDRGGFAYCAPSVVSTWTNCDTQAGYVGSDVDGRVGPLPFGGATFNFSAAPGSLAETLNDLHYHLSWTANGWYARVNDGTLGSPRCAVVLENYVPTFYRAASNMQDATGEQDGCVIRVNSDTTKLARVDRAVTAAHEYTHMVYNVARFKRDRKAWVVGAGDGEAASIVNSESNLERAREQCGDPNTLTAAGGIVGGTRDWWERTQHAAAHAAGYIFTDYPAPSASAATFFILDSEDARYRWRTPPGGGSGDFSGLKNGVPFQGADPPASSFQLARTHIDLSWLVGTRVMDDLYFAPLHGLRGADDGFCTGTYLTGFAARDTRRFVNYNGGTAVDSTAFCSCWLPGNQCNGRTNGWSSGTGACPTTPPGRSEREDAAVRFGVAGFPWLTHEIDRAFNRLSRESATYENRFSDDVTNVWFDGPFVPFFRALDGATGQGACVVASPDIVLPTPANKTQERGPLTLYSGLPDREWDYDNYAFYAARDELYSFFAYRWGPAGRPLEIEVLDKHRNSLAWSNTCAIGLPDDACLRNWLPPSTGPAADMYYVRVRQAAGLSMPYTLQIKRIGDDHSDTPEDATPVPYNQTVFTWGGMDALVNDIDWFRVTLAAGTANRSRLAVYACQTTQGPLLFQAFAGVRNAAGDIVPNLAAPLGSEVTMPAGLDCAPAQGHLMIDHQPSGGLGAGTYFVRVRTTTPGQGRRYRIAVGDLAGTPVSGLNTTGCSTGIVPVAAHWDIKGNADQNRVFRYAGVLQTADATDWFELDLQTDDAINKWGGRLVTVDVIGLSPGGGSTKYFYPRIELYDAVALTTQNRTFYDRDTSCGLEEQPILADTTGAADVCTETSEDSGCPSPYPRAGQPDVVPACSPDAGARLSFRVNRPRKYRLRVAARRRDPQLDRSDSAPAVGGEDDPSVGPVTPYLLVVHVGKGTDDQRLTPIARD